MQQTTETPQPQAASPVQHRWRTAYCAFGMIDANIRYMLRYGFTVRINGRHYYEQIP